MSARRTRLNERKLSHFNKEYLDQFENNKVYKSYSFLVQGLQSLNSDQIDQSHIMLDHMHIRVKGVTVFHLFALDTHLLTLISDEICRVDD